jgi:hypothetical protein
MFVSSIDLLRAPIVGSRFEDVVAERDRPPVVNDRAAIGLRRCDLAGKALFRARSGLKMRF